MMEIHPLGPDNLPVTRMGLGLAALGRPGYINLGHAQDLAQDYDVVVMESRAHHMLDAAYAAGVRYLDAARSYGRAEDFLGSWLRAHPEAAKEVTVGSKWGYAYTAEWRVHAEKHEVKEHSRARLLTQWPESRERLGEALSLYQIHSATPESGVLENTEVLDALADLRAKEGITLGLSVSGPRQADTVRQAPEIRRDGQLLFGCVQASFNLLLSSVGEALAEAHAAGLGIIVKEGLANGRLTARNDSPKFAPAMAELQACAQAENTTVDALALAWVLHHPFVDTVLSGAAQLAHLHSNLAAAEMALSPTIRERLASLAESPEVYWQNRSQLSWN